MGTLFIPWASGLSVSVSLRPVRVGRAGKGGLVSSLKTLFRAWIVMLPSWDACARRGGGLTVTVVADHLVHPQLLARWPDATAREIRLTPEQCDRAAGVLSDIEKTVDRQIRLLRSVIDQGIEAAIARDVDVTVTQLADKLARVLCRLEADGDIVSEIEFAAVVSTYLDNRPPRGRKMPRAEFRAYEPHFTRLWERAGARNLEDFSYHALALGEDGPPPFIRRRRENTWDGLGRSVYSRFVLAAGDAKVGGSGHDVARREIRRACGRLGLRQEAAVVVLHSLAAGFAFGPFDHGSWVRPAEAAIDETWKTDANPVSVTGPLSDDPALPHGPWINAHVGAYAQALVASFVSTTDQGRYLRFRGYMGVACQHAMRRAWMECFAHDRRAAVIDGDAAQRLVWIAIHLGIPSGEGDASKDAVRHRTEKSARPRPEGADGSSGVAAGQAALAASLAWLAEDQPRARALMDRDEQAMEEYEQAVAELGLLPLETLLRYFTKDDES